MSGAGICCLLANSNSKHDKCGKMQYLLVVFAPVLAVYGHVVSLALVGGLVAGAVGGLA